MNIWLLDKDFNNIMLIDQYESFIWTDRYREEGDFEIFAYPSQQYLENIKDNYYIWNADSEHLMIVEHREIKTAVEDGARFIVTGRSLESILRRRVIYPQTTISGNLQNGIKKLLSDCFINPEEIPVRKVSNFVFIESTDPEITKLTYEEQYTGDNLYDIVTKVCEAFDIGFKLIYNFSLKRFEFSLYKGTNRSYDQEDNSYVIFSPRYENIINSDWTHDITELKNWTYVGGEGTGYDRIIIPYYEENHLSGLNMREMFTDARDVGKKDDKGNEISQSDYLKLLSERGKKDLAEYKTKEGFEGEVEASKMFVYGKDFFLGDYLQVENSFGITGKSLVSEIVFSQDKDGEYIYPTFLSLSKED